MTLKEALTRLHCREDWDEVLDYLAKEREPPSWIFNIPTSPTTRTSWPNWPEKLRPSTGCCESCRMIEPCEQFAKKKLRSFARFRSLPAQAPLCSAVPYGSLRYWLAGRRLRRKPRRMKKEAGPALPRNAERAKSAETYQEPPRRTRSEPTAGPTGSRAAPAG